MNIPKLLKRLQLEQSIFVTEQIDEQAELALDITLHSETGAYRLKGLFREYVAHSEFCEIHPICTTAPNWDMLPAFISSLETTLRQKYAQLLRDQDAALKDMNDEASPDIGFDRLETALQPYLDELRKDAFYGNKSRHWGLSTIEYTLRDAYTFLSALYDRYGDYPTDANYFEYFEEVTLRTFEKYSATDDADEETVSTRLTNTRYNLWSRFARVAILQQALQIHYPSVDFPMPKNTLQLIPREGALTFEGIKRCTTEQYVKAVVLLIRLCQMEIPYAFALLPEALAAARIGESCAVNLKGIESNSDQGIEYGRYYIRSQVGNDGQLTEILKNEQSHRYLYLNNLFMRLYRLRKTQLMNRGYTAAQINKMPLGAFSSTPYQYLNKSIVSSFGKDVLILAGCDQAWLEQEAHRLYLGGKLAGNSDDLEICAHKFRGTIASLMINGGASDQLVDCLLGHENADNRRAYYATWDEAFDILHQIDRAIYFGDLSQTSNTAVNPISIDNPCYLDLQGNTCSSFTLAADMIVKHLSFESVEDNQPIILDIQLPENTPCPTPLTEQIHASFRAEDKAERKARLTMEPLPDYSTITNWITAANAIDLTSLCHRYPDR